MVTSVENTARATPLIRVEQLGVEFGSHAVLRGIDLAIGRGETLAIIGESGCGKTVLLKTLIGLFQPTRGTVFFDGQDLAHLNERDLDPAADPLRLRLPASGAVRQHDHRPERGLSLAAAHPQDGSGD